MSEVETIPVPKDQFSLHQRSAQLLNDLLTDPRTAEQAEQLVAQVNPEAKFPFKERREAMYKPVWDELEKERAARQALEAKIAAREAAEAEAAQRQQTDAMVTRLNRIKEKRGFSDEAMEQVMARMRDQNNPDVEAAAAFVAESMPKPPPASGHDFLPTNVDVYGTSSGDAAWESLHKNPDQWLTNELRSIARDPEFARLGNAA